MQYVEKIGVKFRESNIDKSFLFDYYLTVMYKREGMYMSSPASDKYSTATDLDLVRFAKEGEQQALNVLLTRYMAMVRSIASRSFGASLETDDLVQEGMLGLLAAVYSYVPDQAASFHTYASVCVSNRIVSAVRAASRLKHSPLNSYVPLSEAEYAPGGDPEELILAEEQSEVLLSFLSTALSARENKVLRLHLTGKTYSEIADILQVSVKSVDNTLQRVRRKLKFGLQEGS